MSSGWSKENELDYVKGIIGGTTFHHCPHEPLLSPYRMLQNYLRSAKRRMGWGTYFNDGHEIIEYIQRYLGHS